MASNEDLTLNNDSERCRGCPFYMKCAVVETCRTHAVSEGVCAMQTTAALNHDIDLCNAAYIFLPYRVVPAVTTTWLRAANPLTIKDSRRSIPSRHAAPVATHRF